MLNPSLLPSLPPPSKNFRKKRNDAYNLAPLSQTPPVPTTSSGLKAVFSSRWSTAPAQPDASVSVLVALFLELGSAVSLRRRRRRRRRRPPRRPRLPPRPAALRRPPQPPLLRAIDPELPQRPRRLQEVVGGGHLPGHPRVLQGLLGRESRPGRHREEL